jgi:hypothetical protein
VFAFDDQTVIGKANFIILLSSQTAGIVGFVFLKRVPVKEINDTDEQNIELHQPA